MRDADGGWESPANMSHERPLCSQENRDSKGPRLARAVGGGDVWVWGERELFRTERRAWEETGSEVCTRYRSRWVLGLRETESRSVLC